MITIFDRTEKFPRKVNFIDEFNNLIGFDMDSQCCENFGWYVEGTDLSGGKGGGTFILDKYHFNTRSLQLLKKEDDEGGEVTIELTGVDRSCGYFYPQRLPTLVLHLYNNQNGYYGHGFELSIDDEKMVCLI